MAENQLVPVDTEDGALQQVPIPSHLDIFADVELAGAYYTSLPTNTQEGRFAVLSCFDSECKTVDDYVNKTFLARDLLVHAVRKIQADGEIVELVRCVLIGKDPSQLVAWTGVGARRSLQRIGQTFGIPPWDKGMPLTFRAIKVAENRRTHIISVDRGAYQQIYGKEAPYNPPIPGKAKK